MRCAVCRCFRGAFWSVSRIWSTNATAAASFHRGRSTFFRRAGNALPIASRTIRRCTFSFFATPTIVPTPNSYSLRICSNSSTFVLQSTKFLRSGLRPFQSTRSFQRVGQNKLPKWAISKYRNHTRLANSPCPLIFCLNRIPDDPEWQEHNRVVLSLSETSWLGDQQYKLLDK